MNEVNDLWQSCDPQVWTDALAAYWNFVQPANRKLERELETRDINWFKNLDARAWYDFLHDKYFAWKYTQRNYYATTTRSLRWYVDNDRLDDLDLIRQRLLKIDLSHVGVALGIATEIRGLGTAGASGLLSLMYPETFGTVDQFVVKALRQVQSLPDGALLWKMKEKSLSIKDGVLLISIMQRKAAENNRMFGNVDWTPRKIDKILWTFRR